MTCPILYTSCCISAGAVSGKADMAISRSPKGIPLDGRLTPESGLKWLCRVEAECDGGSGDALVRTDVEGSD